MSKSMGRRFLSKAAPLILPYLPHQLYNFGFSGKLIIEPTNICNLKCPLCPTAHNMLRKKGTLGLEEFKYMVDDIAPVTKSINMNFAGEPLLNKDIFKMSKYAESKGIKTMLSTNTTILDRYLDEIFESEISRMIVCLDGASKETHESYRIGSDFERIKENIRLLCREKKGRNLAKPQITLQFVVMKHNEHEVGDIIEIARSLGVDNLNLKTVSLGSWVNVDKRVQLAKKWLPSNQEYSRYEIKDETPQVKSRPKICGWLFQSVILWNGDVTMCCYDFNGEIVIGNIFKEPFQKIWNSARYKKIRKDIVRRELELCKKCAAPLEYGKIIRFNEEQK